MATDTQFLADFQRDIARHEMHIISDEGVNRHIRFQRPGTMNMHFDLLTWPGYLCYTGDMGTYVFRRLPDMFEFFRRVDSQRPYRIDFRYWAEKLEASDRTDGVREFSPDQFRQDVRDYFRQVTEDRDDWPDERMVALWAEIKQQVLEASEISEHHALTALHDFEHDGFQFQDWERDSKVWTHRFLWCCHALEWAIAIYDAAPRTAGILPATGSPGVPPGVREDPQP